MCPRDTSQIIKHNLIYEGGLLENSLRKFKGFKIGHVNIASLTKYIDELRLYMTNNPLDVFSLNETKQIKFGLWVPNVRGRRASHIDQGLRCRLPARVLERPGTNKVTRAMCL